MSETTLLINDATPLEHGTHIPEVHAVLEVIFGSTMAELLLVQHAQLAGLPDLVPWRGVVIDSLPYDDLVARLAQNGWGKHQVAEAIPPLPALPAL